MAPGCRPGPYNYHLITYLLRHGMSTWCITKLTAYFSGTVVLPFVAFFESLTAFPCRWFSCCDDITCVFSGRISITCVSVAESVVPPMQRAFDIPSPSIVTIGGSTLDTLYGADVRHCSLLYQRFAILSAAPEEIAANSGQSTSA